MRKKLNKGDRVYLEDFRIVGGSNHTYPRSQSIIHWLQEGQVSATFVGKTIDKMLKKHGKYIFELDISLGVPTFLFANKYRPQEEPVLFFLLLLVSY